MKVIRKSVSRVLLLWALLVAAFAVAMLFNDKAFTRKSAVPAFLIFGAPALGTGAWLAYGLKRQEEEEQAILLQQVFYRLVQSGDGAIGAFQLAMEAQISGNEARAYLDRCAREFDGTFDVTDDGRFLYRFEVNGLESRLSASGAAENQSTPVWAAIDRVEL